MSSHRGSLPMQQHCLNVHSVFSLASDAATGPSLAAEISCDTMRTEKFATSLIVTQQPGDIMLNPRRCMLPSIKNGNFFFRDNRKPEMVSKQDHYSSGSNDCVCGDGGLVLNTMHSDASRYFSLSQDSDSCTRSSYIPSRFLNLFKDSELQMYKREAISDYILLRNKVELRDFIINERIIREEIEGDAFSKLQAIHTRFYEESSKFSILAEASGRVLLKLQSRLQKRENVENTKNAEWEARLLEEGRCAWQEEVRTQEEKAKEEVERSKKGKSEENKIRAAVVFIICSERTDRAFLEREAETAWNELCSKEAEESKEAEQLAYERFMNSPEQLALATERKRKALKERKKKARLQKILQAEQKRIIDRCHHGRNGISLLENPGAQKGCYRCRIFFDENLGYYINSDSSNSFVNPLKRKQALPMAVSAPLRNTIRRK